MLFALDGDPSPSELSNAVNYLLGNLVTGLAANETTGQIIAPGGIVVAYIYKYLAVKYADSFDGSVGFSNSPTNKAYYGLRNTDSPVESTNPADYIWYEATGGFGTTKFLFYLTSGGRSITFVVSTTAPSQFYKQDPGTSIDLDFVTAATMSPANFAVIRTPNDFSPPTDAEVLAAIGRLPIENDLCIVNYNGGIASIQYKYVGGWVVFQKILTGDLIVANSITATNIAAATITSSQIAANTIVAGNIASGTITATQIAANSITVNEINNVSTGQIIAGSFNFDAILTTGTSTWVVPPYVYKIKVTVIGGGGGAASFVYPGGGGAGGGCIGVFAVTPGDSYTAVVGAGGGRGSTGGSSSFSGPGISITCLGGRADTTRQGGSGGTASGGQLNVTGGSGGGTSSFSYAPVPGLGGNSFFGGGGGDGRNGSPNTGGGGGGIASNSGGGSGGSGIVIVEY
jgi:hypothetical protein